MDFRFGLFVIFLILDVISVLSTDNGWKKNNKVQLSGGIANNLFLQSINPSTQNNNFQSPNDNKNSFSSSASASDNSPVYFPDDNRESFYHNPNNPFFSTSTGTNSRVDTELLTSPVAQHSSTSRPVAQHSSTSSSGSLSLDELVQMKISVGQKTISEIKCEEYIEAIAGTTYISALTGGRTDVRKVVHTCQETNRLVVGGTDARDGEFPHMVALGKYSSNEFTLMCGGTLISHSWVLTAAHCSYGPNGGPTDARVGFHRLTDQEGVSIAVKDITKHPDFKPPAMYADIALVELMNPVTFGKFIRPACLYQKYDTVPREAWISGWGTTAFGDYMSNTLKKAKLEMMDNMLCTIRHNSSLEVPYGVTTSMICAGSPRQNWSVDTCQGDSGGPLQIISTNKTECLFQVIGITSFGIGCAMVRVPGVYTRVSHYIPWIEDIVWPRRQ